MTIIEALRKAEDGAKVRPTVWRTINPEHWVYAVRMNPSVPVSFVEGGTFEEMPHALRLCSSQEFLGEWEEFS